MGWPRIRFSIRALLIAISIVGGLLGLTIRFGPHLVYQLFSAPGAPLAVVPRWKPNPIPSQPLLATRPEEPLVRCEVGSLACEMPRDLSQAFEVHLGKFGGGYVQFGDEQRRILLFLPAPQDSFYDLQATPVPHQAKLSFPRIEAEILSWDPADFSWSMSHQELRWHQWLLNERTHKGVQVEAVEYDWRSDLDGLLVTYPTGHGFLWATTDGRWEGSVVFQGTTRSDRDWIRQLCSTFKFDGDGKIFTGRSPDEVKSLVLREN